MTIGGCTEERSFTNCEEVLDEIPEHRTLDEMQCRIVRKELVFIKKIITRERRLRSLTPDVTILLRVENHPRNEGDQGEV